MKNYFLLFLSIFVLFSCNKDDVKIQSESVEKSSNYLSNYSSCSDFQTTCTDIICAIADSEDSDNNRNNMIIYHYANAINAAINSSQHLPTVIQAVQDANDNEIQISSIMGLNTGMKSFIMQEVWNSVSQNTTIYPMNVAGFDITTMSQQQLIQYLDSNLSYGSDSYVPVVYTVKDLSSYDAYDNQVAVFIGEEINDCDEIIGWKNNQITLVGEDDVTVSNDVHLIVSVGDIEDDASRSPFVDDIDTQFRSMSTTIEVDRYQIKKGYRYERNKRSEIRAIYLRFDPSTPRGSAYHFWQDFKPKRIHKNDINDSRIFTDNADAFSVPTFDFERGISLFVAAYEHDWWSTLKKIDNDCSNWTGHTLRGKRKYLNEVYFKDCGVMNTWYPNVYSHKIFENQKCMFDTFRLN